MGKSQETMVQITLPNGDPSGIRIAEVHLTERFAGSLCKPSFSLASDCGSSGKTPNGPNGAPVYVLVGKRDEAAKPDVYIGQSFKPGERLANHDRDPAKDFWEMTVVAIASAPFFAG